MSMILIKIVVLNFFLENSKWCYDCTPCMCSQSNWCWSICKFKRLNYILSLWLLYQINPALTFCALSMQFNLISKESATEITVIRFSFYFINNSYQVHHISSKLLGLRLNLIDDSCCCNQWLACVNLLIIRLLIIDKMKGIRRLR